MKILHLSDTHNQHRQLKSLPKADIIIHSGDVSEAGTEHEVLDFLNWFADLDYPHKILVAGNHDFCLDGERIDGLPPNFHYLCHSGTEIEGIKFWGIPLFMSEASQRNFSQRVAQIPENTDVLITHRPPYGILDFADNYNYGCADLLQAVLKIKPKYHLFGHIHDGYGVEKHDNTDFVNAAIMDKDYKMANEPVLLEIKK